MATARAKNPTIETAGQNLALKLLENLRREHEALGQRLALAAEQAKVEMDKLEAEAQVCAAELGEARVEIAELRAAHEAEEAKRVAAEADARKLRAKLAGIMALCVEADEEAPLGGEPEIETTNVDDDLGQLLPVALGMNPNEIDALDALAIREGAPDRRAILRLLVQRALAASGLLPEAGSATSAGADDMRERAHPIPC